MTTSGQDQKKGGPPTKKPSPIRVNVPVETLM